MATWTPDPTFYTSPKKAMDAPQEEIAYVAIVNPKDDGRPDAVGVMDVNPESSDFGKVISRLELPHSGDELHHFGWNACSASLCPNMPHPHVERRYLLFGALRSSRIYIVDTQPDPLNPTIAKVIEADELAEKTGYSRPHTVHCGPDAIYMNALGAPDGGGPGGVFMLDHDTFDVKGAWESDRGSQVLSYDFWWHLNHDTMITSEWGTPAMVENGVQADLLVNSEYGHKLHVWDLRERKHLEELDMGPENQMALELRPAHDPRKTYGFVGVVTSVKDLSGSVWLWYRDNGKWAIRKVIEIPAEPAEPDQLPPLLKGFGAVPSGDYGHQPVPGRQVLVCLVLGDGRIPAVRRVRPVQSAADRLGPPGRHRSKGRASEQRQSERRAADGRGESGRTQDLRHQLTLRCVGRPILSRRRARLGCQDQRFPRWWTDFGQRFLRRVWRRASAPDQAPGRRLFVRLILLPGLDRTA